MGIRFTGRCRLHLFYRRRYALEELCYRRRWVPEATEPARVSVSSARIGESQDKDDDHDSSLYLR